MAPAALFGPAGVVRGERIGKPFGIGFKFRGMAPDAFHFRMRTFEHKPETFVAGDVHSTGSQFPCNISRLVAAHAILLQ